MKLGIMQPYFFPYIGYWQLMNVVDKYVIYDDVNFIKGGWINRNRILMNSEGKMINVQMNAASPNKLINEVEVSCNKIFNKKLLKTIESCYKKAPYYSNIFPIIENIITQDEKNLAKYLEYSIRKVCKYLSIDTEVIISSTINKNNNLKGQDKVIEICKVLGADEYYNAVGGQELYSYEDFLSEGLKLKFLKTGSVEYKQFDNEFIPNLSIIDVMMFNSKEEIRKILNQYKLL
ncbi:WbqC family protein [Clostridium botulinum]|nr:WbqC family protein [Clostridium botulinum]NFO11344.1 WbqC family protein [Clostridium botulinum]NFO91971.1 WbqC family protein [Clostridium botulinum]